MNTETQRRRGKIRKEKRGEEGVVEGRVGVGLGREGGKTRRDD